ncbi:DUF1853 family protein [Rhodospirillales bacterium]|nr:DUF1853 family protein [Rhodospirillales bacterium]
MRFDQFPSWLQRDIKWLESSPALLGDGTGSQELIRRTCQLLIKSSQEIGEKQLEILAGRRSAALGRYFETLVQIVITLSPEVESCHHNITIHDGIRTCGELDILYKMSGRWVHLELAVKFYIGLGDRSDPHQWYGPAARETLWRKLKRLTEHQLILPGTKAGVSALDRLDISAVHSEALVMGRLFHPIINWQKNDLITPAEISQNHSTGWWCRATETAVFAEVGDVKWRVLEKPDWLSSGNMAIPKTTSLPTALKEVGLTRALMITGTLNNVELYRGFVVPDYWAPLNRSSS